MKKHKWLAAVTMTSVLFLAACGTDEAEETNDIKEEVVEQETIDLTKEAEAFKANAVEQMPLFVEDLKLLKQQLDENKLEDAQKLYPLVRMHVERLQPLKSSFEAEFKVLDGKVAKGKEADVTGFAKVEQALFAEKSAATASKELEAVVKAAENLSAKLETAQLDGMKVLDDATQMLANAEKQLNGGEASFVAIDVYEVKANVEAVEQLVPAFMARAETATAAKLTEETVAFNKVVEFYEIGKEDYIKYDIFTNAQKTELITALKNVQTTFTAMKDSIK